MKINEKGQILIAVTLVFVVLALFAGLAVDIGRAYLMKARLSRVVDAAALAAAKALKGQTAFENDAITAACDAAKLNGLTCGGKDAVISVGFESKPVEGGPPMEFVQITGTASIPTTLMRLLSLIGAGDFSKLNFQAFAEAGPERPVDLVLALDRSRSMEQTDVSGQTKIEALQRAVNEFLNNNFSALDRIGLVSFATRGCGDPNTGKDFIGDVDCAPDMPLKDLTPGYLGELQGAVSSLVADGGTNTMEALNTAGDEINKAFSDSSRATSRKVVLLVTDGQPTFMRRFTTSECNTNPNGGDLGFPGTFPNGCLFGVPLWKLPSFWPSPPSPGLPKPGMFRTLLTDPNAFPCSTRIPPFQFFVDDLCGAFTGPPTLYQNIIGSARRSAIQQANTIRGYGTPENPNNVLIFAIAIGTDTRLTSPQDSLDDNAMCLLARIANAKRIKNAATDTETSMSVVCSNVFTTLVDGDQHLDLKENCPPCINSTQKEGTVWTVNVSAGDCNVECQLQKIFKEVAALLQLRLTV